ncbi:hypothetical protein [Spiroplasma clarkii]|nr:hypothetical protein [Spiroplasma clarkii]
MRNSLTKQDQIKIFNKGEHLQAQNEYFSEYNKILQEFLSQIK